MKAIRAAVTICSGVLSAALTARAPERLVIDPTATSITIQVGRAGVFAFAGHDHEIVAPVGQGEITLDRSDVSRSAVSVVFDAAALKVTGKGEPLEDVAEVQRVMLSDRVLDVKKYPTITFQSQNISVQSHSAERMTLRITGQLELHGMVRPLKVPVNVRMIGDRLRADGKVTVRQTDFGIRPVTAGAGTVRVKDEIEIIFAVIASER